MATWPASPRPRVTLGAATFSGTTARITVESVSSAENLSQFHIALQINGTAIPASALTAAGSVSLVLGPSTFNVTWHGIHLDGNLGIGGTFLVTPSAASHPYFEPCTFTLLWSDGTPLANVSFIWPPAWTLEASWNLNGQAVKVGSAFPVIAPTVLEVELDVNGTNGTPVALPATPRTLFEVPVGSVNYPVTWLNPSGSGLLGVGDWFQVHYAAGSPETPVGTPMTFVVFRVGYGVVAAVSWSAETHG